jgi:ATP-dependent RNA helicase UAP56/SUB2
MLEQLDKIYVHLPKVKQVMMFSATMDDDLRKKATTYMKAPMTVTVQAEELCLAGLELYEVGLKENEKNEKLTALLDDLEFNQVVIFVSSQRRCDALQKLMCDSWNFPAIAIHGNLPQPTRTTNFRKFKNGDSRFLVATDLMGRGIDVEGVNVVVNYDMPPDAHQFLHRIGRAGRFGTKGLAISFLSSAEDKKVMEEVREKFGVTVESLPDEIDPSTYSMSSQSHACFLMDCVFVAHVELTHKHCVLFFATFFSM